MEVLGLVIVIMLVAMITYLAVDKFVVDPDLIYANPEPTNGHVGVQETPNPNYRSVNLMDLNFPNPAFSKYTDRERDIMGMDGADYYLENDMLARDGVFPVKHGIKKFEAAEGGLPGQRGNGFMFFQNEYSDLPIGLTQSDLPIPGGYGGSVESAEQYTF